MKKVNVFLINITAAFLVSTSLFGQTTTETNSSAVQSAWNNFKTTNPNAFANTFLLDGNTIIAMLSAGAASVRVCNAMLSPGGTHILVLMPCDNKGKAISSQYYFENSTDLCPVNCDLNIAATPAIKTDAATASSYISYYLNSKLTEPVSSFLINTFASQLGSGNSIKVFNVINSGTRTIAVVAINGGGVETGNYYFADPNEYICPPVCAQ